MRTIPFFFQEIFFITFRSIIYFLLLFCCLEFTLFYFQECECESGCSNCTIHFELDKEGKMKKNNKPTSIISEDIVIDDERVKVAELAGYASSVQLFKLFFVNYFIISTKSFFLI